MTRFFIAALVFTAAIAQNPNTAVFPGAVATDNDLLVATDNARTTLAVAVNNSITSIVLSSATNFVTPLVMTIDNEKLVCLTHAGTTYTCTRGAQGSTAATHSFLSLVHGNVTAYPLNQLAAEVKAVENTLGATLQNVLPGIFPAANSPKTRVPPPYRPTVTATNLRTYGDSQTAGSGASPLSTAYVSVLASAMNAALTNRGVGGYQACDEVQWMFQNENPPDSQSPVYTSMIGVNDANFKGAGSYEAVYNACNQAMLTWLGTSVSYKLFAQAATTTAGSFTADNSGYQSGLAASSTTNGSAKSFALTTTGGPIYLWYQIKDGNGGTFSWNLDSGAQTGNASCFTAVPIATQSSGTKAVALLRITGVAAGSHTLLTTVTSATGAGNIVELLAAGTPSTLSRFQSPMVFSGGVTRQQSDAKAADTAAYNADAAANVILLAGDGLPVYFADVRSYVNATSDMFDSLHFCGGTNCGAGGFGHHHAFDAFANAMQFAPNGSQGAFQLSVQGTVPVDVSQYPTVNGNNYQSTSSLNGGLCVFQSQFFTSCYDWGAGTLPGTGIKGSPNVFFHRLFGAGNTPLVFGTNNGSCNTSGTNNPTCQSGFNNEAWVQNGYFTLAGLGSTTACASAETSPAHCNAAFTGAFIIAAGATSVQVFTTAVGANSNVFITPNSSSAMSTRLGVTCNSTVPANLQITAQTSTNPTQSFTLSTSAAPTTNPACFSYTVIN